jgi:hypothetical protein
MGAGYSWTPDESFRTETVSHSRTQLQELSDNSLTAGAAAVAPRNTRRPKRESFNVPAIVAEVGRGG